MMRNTDVLEALAAWVPPVVRQWNPRWEADVTDWVEPDLALVGDAAWGATVRDAVQLPVADPLAWANRRVDLSDGGWAVAGIRFRGRDVTKPFVDVIATTATPDADGLGRLAALMEHYAAFAPLCLRVHLPGDRRSHVRPPGDRLGAAAGGGPDVRPDQLVVAGRVQDMRVHPRSARSADVELVPTTPDAAAEHAATLYAGIRRARPELDEWAAPSDADGLESAADEGLLFAVTVDGVPAGIVAAERDDAYGMTGFAVQEIVLDDAHRGQGLGTATMQLLADALPAAPDDVLWGHIHPDNAASLANAESTGRQVVSTLTWVTPEGHPGMP